MALKLMYITNRPEIAQIAENAGVNRIFVDMEYIGKDLRQGGMHTVQNHHTIEDVRRIKDSVSKAEVLCRVNPIHEKNADYTSSKEEIDGVIEAGADVLMLPFFKTKEEVETFINLVNKRARTMLLIETPEAVDNIDEILNVDGIDEVHIGLNDLSLGYKRKFMFELLTDGTVENLCLKFKKKGVKYGIGGIAGLHKGMLPAEMIIKEHYRLGSTCAILSRSFCNTDLVTDLNEVKNIFESGLKEIRAFEKECEERIKYFSDNEKEVADIVNKIVEAK